MNTDNLRPTDKDRARARIIRHFEQNMLDGDSVQSGQWLSAESVLGYILENYFDYSLKKLEVRGIEQYQEMRNAPTLSEDAVLAFINQLSSWNLRTTGAEILRAYLAQKEKDRADD